MAIYGRTGCEVVPVRRATQADADAEAREAGGRPWEPESLVWVRYAEDADQEDRLYALPFLRADGGLVEIMDAIRKLPEVYDGEAQSA